MDDQSFSQEAEELIRNAELRAELEPYYDESISRINVQHLPLRYENEFLAAMLAWETAPILPVYRWFEPELRPPQPDTLDDAELSRILEDLIVKLYEKKIVLNFTDHLSDRELYWMILRDILPSREKKLEHQPSEWHWDFSVSDSDPNIWLVYYASDEDRENWAAQYGQPLPEKAIPRYHRQMPYDTY